MTLEEVSPYAHNGWTITRLAWNNPEFYLRRVKLNGKWVFQASHPALELTVEDMHAKDWINLAQVN
jgi:hypothetical protein